MQLCHHWVSEVWTTSLSYFLVAWSKREIKNTRKYWSLHICWHPRYGRKHDARTMWSRASKLSMHGRSHTLQYSPSLLKYCWSKSVVLILLYVLFTCENYMFPFLIYSQEVAMEGQHKVFKDVIEPLQNASVNVFPKLFSYSI